MGRKARKRADAKAAQRAAENPKSPDWTPPVPRQPEGASPSGRGSWSTSGGLGGDDDEPWELLRSRMLDEFPVCPRCGAEWDWEYPGEEVGPAEGGILYTLFVTCTGPEEHDVTYELVVEDEGRIRTGQTSGR